MEVIVVADEFFFSGSNADGIKWKFPYQMYQLQYRQLATEFGAALISLDRPTGHCKVPHLGSMEKLSTFSTMRSSAEES